WSVIFSASACKIMSPCQDPFTPYYFDKTSEQLRAAPAVPRSVLPFIDPATHTAKLVQWAVRHIPVPAFSYFKGLYRLYNHNHTGHASYLLGRHSLFGWWYYFPVAFLVKSPIALVTLTGLTIAAFLSIRRNVWILLPTIIYF